MDTVKQLRDELTHEYHTTKKFFDRFPEGKNDYAPHQKSMKMMPLAQHIAEVFGWPTYIIDTNDLDFADSPRPELFQTKQQLIDSLDKNYQSGMKTLENVDEARLDDTWAIKMKGQKLAEWSKYGAIRHALNQATHHRAQLGVYYRLNEIPLPGSYGPSADEQSFG